MALNTTGNTGYWVDPNGTLTTAGTATTYYTVPMEYEIEPPFPNDNDERIPILIDGCRYWLDYAVGDVLFAYLDERLPTDARLTLVSHLGAPFLWRNGDIAFLDLDGAPSRSIFTGYGTTSWGTNGTISISPSTISSITFS